VCLRSIKQFWVFLMLNHVYAGRRLLDLVLVLVPLDVSQFTQRWSSCNLQGSYSFYHSQADAREIAKYRGNKQWVTLPYVRKSCPASHRAYGKCSMTYPDECRWNPMFQVTHGSKPWRSCGDSEPDGHSSSNKCQWALNEHSPSIFLDIQRFHCSAPL